MLSIRWAGRVPSQVISNTHAPLPIRLINMDSHSPANQHATMQDPYVAVAVLVGGTDRRLRPTLSSQQVRRPWTLSDIVYPRMPLAVAARRRTFK